MTLASLTGVLEESIMSDWAIICVVQIVVMCGQRVEKMSKWRFLGGEIEKVDGLYFVQSHRVFPHFELACVPRRARTP